MRGDEVVSVRGDAEDVFSHGFLCPKSQGLQAAPRRSRPAHAAARAPRRRARRGELGGGLRGRRRAGSPRVLAEGGRDAVAVYIGNPGRPQPRPDPLRRAAHQGARHEEHLLGLDGRPDAEAGLRRADVRRRAERAGPRRRPHRPPADPRRQPAGLQRLAADRARHARPHPRDPRARRQGRGRRSAPQPHRPRGLRAPLHPPRHRRAPAVRDRQHAARRGARRTPGRLAEHADGAERSASWPQPFAPEAVAPVCGIDADEIRRMARELGGRRARGGLRADRHHDAALRHARELARRRAQLPDRQPRPRGRGDVPARRRGPAQLGRHRPGSGKGFRIGPLGEPGQRPARRCSASCPSSGWPRRSRRPARARSARWSRSPATRWSRPPTPGRSRRRSRTLDFIVSIDIYVNETTRHADVILPAPEPLAKAHYDTALYQLAVRSVANYSPPILDARRRPARRVGGDAAPRGDRRRPGTRRGHRGLGRARRSAPWSGARWRLPGSPIEGRDAGRARSPRSAIAAAPSGCSTSCSASARSATGSAPTPTGSRSRSSRRTRTASTSARCARASPRCSARPRARSSSRREEIVADVPRLEAELGAPASTARWS